MKTFAIALISLLAGASLVAPSELLTADVPDEFEIAVDPPTDLTFDEYAELAPDATAHVDSTQAAALSMRAAVDVWTSDTNEILLREVTRWASDDDADAFVEQATVAGIQNSLDAVDPPFAGGVAFLGADEGLWTRTVAWRQGPYAMSVSHFGVSEGTDEILDRTATELADGISDATGLAIAPQDGGETEEPETNSGGIGVGTVLFLFAVIGGSIWVVLWFKRRRAMSSPDAERHGSDRIRDERRDRDDGDDDDDEPTDVDDIIERARARGRAEREVESIPDPTESGWTPPDDY